MLQVATGEIREVWAANLDEEFRLISKLIRDYPYVGIDTEFPGFLVQSNPRDPLEKRYFAQRVNVNALRIIQVGITLGNAKCVLCSPCTWQFNFKFSLANDVHSSDGISVLTRAGIDFGKLEKDGIDVVDFTQLLFASGLVLNDNITWVCFHGSYDFAYLVKMLSGDPLPSDVEFLKLFKTYFPRMYDMKQIVFSLDGRQEGLESVARSLGVNRIGSQHQAGSDSFVTLKIFYVYMMEHFHSLYNEEFEGKMFGF